jgi:uncharacterized protein YbjT (DUF2867 family)
MAAVVVAVIPGSSASGRACLRKLLERAPDSSGGATTTTVVRACFRSQFRADGVHRKLMGEGGSTTATSAATAADSAAPPRVWYESFVGVDARDVDSLKRALEGAHRALLVTPLDHNLGLQNDAANSINMIRAARDVGVRRIVHVGSWTVNAPRRLPLLSSRFLPTEAYLRDEIGTALEWTVLRGGYFMDNFARVPHVTSIMERDELLSVPDCKIPPVDVRDIGEAAANLLGMDDATYHGTTADDGRSRSYDQSFVECCGPDNLSHSQIAERLGAGLGRTIRYGVESSPSSSPEGWSVGNPIVDELYRYMADGTGDNVPYDPEPFARLLGRSPTPLEEWAASHRRLFEKN